MPNTNTFHKKMFLIFLLSFLSTSIFAQSITSVVVPRTQAWAGIPSINGKVKTITRINSYPKRSFNEIGYIKTSEEIQQFDFNGNLTKYSKTRYENGEISYISNTVYTYDNGQLIEATHFFNQEPDQKYTFFKSENNTIFEDVFDKDNNQIQRIVYSLSKINTIQELRYSSDGFLTGVLYVVNNFRQIISGETITESGTLDNKQKGQVTYENRPTGIHLFPRPLEISIDHSKQIFTYEGFNFTRIYNSRFENKYEGTIDRYSNIISEISYRKDGNVWVEEYKIENIIEYYE